MTGTAVTDRFCPVRRAGSGFGHHFFGYYNKNPWDPTGRWLLAHRVPVMTANLIGKEVAEVGFFDLENGGVFHAVGSTTTWNWQMGAQLQWLEGFPGRQIIYNTRSDGRGEVYPDFRATIHDIDAGETHHLPLPVYSVAPDSSYAVSVDYARFQVTHRTIGYGATFEEPVLENAPDDDGIYVMDLRSGDFKLVLSLRDLFEFQHVPSMDRAIHWVTHLEISSDSKHILFIHRWTERVEDETCFLHRLFTVKPDGTDLRLLECSDHPLPQLRADFDPDAVGTFDYEKSEYQISHPMWQDNDHVIVWGPHRGRIHYHLYDIRSGEAERVGHACLTENGHMSYSTDGRWLLSDTYPDSETNERYLILYDVRGHCRYNIGSFYTDPGLGKENRCDLHPRWSRDCRQVCIDSVHENQRQMYIIDVADLVAG